MVSPVSSVVCLVSRLASRASRRPMAAAVLAAAAMLAAAPALADDHTGSCVDKAPNLIVSTKDDKPKSFVLTPEYDEDTGKYCYEESYTNSQGVVTNVVATTNFVYYFKLNCKNGKDYTVWIEGANS